MSEQEGEREVGDRAQDGQVAVTVVGVNRQKTTLGRRVQPRNIWTQSPPGAIRVHVSL